MRLQQLIKNTKRYTENSIFNPAAVALRQDFTEKQVDKNEAGSE